MAEYRLLTTWRIRAPLQHVYGAVTDSLRWPEWWPGVEQVDEIAPGGNSGVGNVRRYVWKGRLPYRIRFDAHTTRIDPETALEATVSGDLEGTGRWVFRHDDGVTTVRYEWNVRTTRRWMNLTAPIARPLFTDNHHLLMTQGAHGLARKLGGCLLEVIQHHPQNGLPPSPHQHGIFNPVTACLAGIAAGGIATVVQLLAWWMAGYPAWEMLLRDSRYAAAIALGPAVLPPPIGFDWQIMLVAGAIHGVLSVIYGLALTALAVRLHPFPGLAAGSLFGLALFALNMFGMTTLFPWFVASRDWITAFAHLAFGAAMMPLYRLLSQPWGRKRREENAR